MAVKSNTNKVHIIIRRIISAITAHSGRDSLSNFASSVARSSDSCDERPSIDPFSGLFGCESKITFVVFSEDEKLKLGEGFNSNILFAQ